MILPLIASIIVATNSVSFTVTATGVDEKTPIEFIIAGPESDRDYETLFLSEDPIPEILAAIRSAGVPSGVAYDPARCDFWPTGAVLDFRPSITSLVAVKDATLPITQALFTGGNGNFDMPQAFFALYACGQSPVLMDGALDQSVAYGNYFAKRKCEKGEKLTLTISWAGDIVSDFTPDFPADKTVAEAVKLAQGLAKADSTAFRINGCKEGQFYYKAFLPKVQWLDRRERLTQPIEVRLTSTNETYTIVDEDWSGEGIDPILTPRLVDKSVAVTSANDTVFLYAGPDTKLGRLYALRKELAPEIRNVYVFTEGE